MVLISISLVTSVLSLSCLCSSCVFALGGPEAVVGLTCSAGVRSVAPRARAAESRDTHGRAEAPGPRCGPLPWQDPGLPALEGRGGEASVGSSPGVPGQALMGTRLWEEAGAERASDLQRTADGNNTDM